MSFTLAAFAESLDPAAALVNFAAVADPHLTVSGDDLLIPELDQLLFYGACIDQTVASYARLRSPSMLEDGFEEYIAPLASGLTFGAPPEIIDKSKNPINLKRIEALQFQALTNPAAAAVHYCIVGLGDGAPTPAGGKIRTVRCTAAITLSAVAWVNGALTFPVSLKAGRYAVVGARFASANLVAGRLVFPGMAWRPGGPAANDEADEDFPLFRDGNLGVWGEFDSSSPPTVDLLGVTDTSEEVFLDVIYLG